MLKALPLIAAIGAAALFMATKPIFEAAADAPNTAHDFAFTGIDGADLPLADFKGRPVLVVNTASRCGFTPQYDGLQALWSRYRDQGLVVIGAPSNDFNQELESEAAVKEFCAVNFALDFPMTEILQVKGPGAHPFYAWAAREVGAPRWNFFKYLIDAEGRILDLYPSHIGPDHPKLIAAIDAQLR